MIVNQRLSETLIYCSIRKLELEMGVGKGFLTGTMMTNVRSPLNPQPKQKDFFSQPKQKDPSPNSKQKDSFLDTNLSMENQDFSTDNISKKHKKQKGFYGR